jgi:hypothetical protein
MIFSSEQQSAGTGPQQDRPSLAPVQSVTEVTDEPDGGALQTGADDASRPPAGDDEPGTRKRARPKLKIIK